MCVSLSFMCAGRERENVYVCVSVCVCVHTCVQRRAEICVRECVCVSLCAHMCMCEGGESFILFQCLDQITPR